MGASIAPADCKSAIPGVWPYALPGELGATRWLESLGLKPGDRVALAGLNSLGNAQLLVAGLRYGLTLVLLNRRLTASELADQLERAACVRVLADPAHPVATITEHAAIPSAFTGDIDTVGPPTGALVLFTSGTSGTPKAARLGSAAIAAATSAHVAALGLTEADTWACPLPLDHVGGAMCVLRAVASGCRVHIHDQFDAAALSDDLDAGATGTSVVPTMLRRMVEHRAGRKWPAHVRRLLTGGGPLDQQLARACADLGLPPSQTYGMTEMGSMITVLDPTAWERIPRSAGQTIPDARVAVQGGRLLVAGAMLFDGYEDRGRLIPRTDIWHPTGDLGAIDGDGFLTVRSRVAELIISGGENVSATEVEAAIESHPAVVEAAVCGLPDAEWGEIVAAAVVLRREACTEEIATHIANILAPFKRPKRWAFVEELPRTGAGKVRRAEVRGLFRHRVD